jgi:ABC-2 type transport system permease protein
MELIPATMAFDFRARQMYWLITRELWENRSIYIAPLAAVVLLLLGYILGMSHLAAKMRASAALAPMEQQDLFTKPLVVASGLIMVVTLLVAIFYCLDALYGERRDRSILFWKSMPVSDLATVLSKAAIPLVILPLLTFSLTVVTQSLMLLVNGAVLAGSGAGAGAAWSHLALFHIWVMLFYHLVAIHSLWHAPLYAWLLLVSSWARRVVILWAALPILAILALEKLVFNTSYFGMMLMERLTGPMGVGSMGNKMAMDSMTHVTPAEFLASAGLWIGLGVTAVFLLAAAWIRRYRGPV